MANVIRIPTVLSMALVILIFASLVSSEGESCHDNKPCGDDEFCNEHDYSCGHCSEICVTGAQSKDCEKKCKDYLIIQRIAVLENNLYTTIIIFAVILVILILMVAIIVARWCRKNGYCSMSRLKRFTGVNDKLPPPTMEYTHENPNTKSPKLSARINPNNNGSTLPPTPHDSGIGSSPTAVTTISGTDFPGYMGMDRTSMRTLSTPLSRTSYPAEDWRENHCYDNGGLAVTPMENTYEYVEANMNQRMHQRI
ncbi:protein grindelwald-like [Uranotaenia lowii]|uniref:protein grindelwald-like n=1 Tax=Uranotaenia lowii TaxID=190385 RepID=UPI002478ACCF|nr:protein grindelwald-like [Uranotaenia lowii]